MLTYVYHFARSSLVKANGVFSFVFRFSQQIDGLHQMFLINILDVNECALGDSGCEHNCQNVAGSYDCICDFGYALSEDRRTCHEVARK